MSRPSPTGRASPPSRMSCIRASRRSRANEAATLTNEMSPAVGPRLSAVAIDASTTAEARLPGLREHPSGTIVGVEIAMTRKESTMIRQILAAASVALGLAGTPAVAQQSPSPDQPMAQEADPTLVGLSVYSSDGQK